MQQDDYAELIAAIKSGSRAHLDEVYLTYRDSFLEWSQARYKCSEADARDIYQDVIIVFYENVLAGKVEHLRSKLRTYLFGIGKILIIKRFHATKRQDFLEEADDVSSLPEIPEGQVQLELNDRQQILRTAIANLGEKCKDLLLLCYYRRYSTDSIMEELGYKNADVVKSQKARCMRMLRQRFQSQFNKDLI